MPEELREKIARKLALYKYGGTEADLYPHWIRDALVEADDILILIKEAALGTPFKTHKSLNILYKELRAHEIFVRTLADGGSIKELKEQDVEIIKPQSWRFYTHEKLISRE